MTASIVQLERFRRDFCMFDIIVLQIDSDTSSVSFSLMIIYFHVLLLVYF